MKAATVLLAAIVAVAACSGKRDQPKAAPAAGSDAPAAAAGWTARCGEVLRNAPTMTPVRRLAAVIDGCRPCGDWTPLLHWNTPFDEKGPPLEVLEQAMTACNAYCSNDSKMQFLGTLEPTRGKPSNRPWRLLGEKCGEAVSAVPDVRYMSAPYFALDRIARATAADPELAPLAAAFELPLPAVSITGIGFTLPTAAVMKPEPGTVHVTVTPTEIRVGTLATAKLTPNGVAVDLGAAPYPGELVDEPALQARLDALFGSPTGRVVIIGATGVPALRIINVVRSVGAHEAVLAVAAAGGPHGWSLPGVLPLLLDVKPPVKGNPDAVWLLGVDAADALATVKSRPATAFAQPRVEILEGATVAGLAELLGALAFRDAKTVSLVRYRSPKPRP